MDVVLRHFPSCCHFIIYAAVSKRIYLFFTCSFTEATSRHEHEQFWASLQEDPLLAVWLQFAQQVSGALRTSAKRRVSVQSCALLLRTQTEYCYHRFRLICVALNIWVNWKVPNFWSLSARMPLVIRVFLLVLGCCFYCSLSKSRWMKPSGKQSTGISGSEENSR